MTRPRVSIAGLMVLVLCVAINFAVFRLLLGLKREYLAGLVLTLPLLQVGVWRLFRERGRGRAFWAGFVACGVAATGVFVAAMLHPPSIAPDPVTRVYVVTSGGSWLWRAWDDYLSFVRNVIEPLLKRLNVDLESGVPIVVLSVVVWSLPQLATALVGGALAQAVWTKRESLDSRPVRGSAPGDGEGGQP